ncbi:hypothetical protein THRCLA_07863 [Thraustotheca clavata]|uniref:PHD-type domain-containing protein n=1 Tax=Thraustotheca clavata TaxID=74557 RepID=A0A1V9ZC70_9STRA|nr:hypothetical protein THRCLA_07863 [Thraustotheca clavata]
MPMNNISPTHMRDEILPQCQFPIQCWFKKRIPLPSTVPSSAAPKAEPVVKSESVVKAEPVEVNSSEEWPWCYLRSDGKLAMPQVWRVFNEMFHSKEIDTSALLESLKGPESLYVIPPLGYLDIPDVIYDHRKQIYAAKSAQSLTALPPLEVGTMVNVAKRTWPGINKLGGTGRIKARREGENGIFVYDVAYVLGGRENQIDRQYITPVTLDDPIGAEQKKEANSDKSLAWSLQGAFVVKEANATGNEEFFKVSFSVDAESDKIEHLNLSTHSGNVKATFRLDSVVDVFEEHIPDEIGPQLHALQDQLRQIDTSSREAFEKLTKLLENEKKQAYFTAMQELTNKEYEEMYRKMMVLHEEHFGPVNPPLVKSKKTVAAENKPVAEEEDDSDEDVDLTLFITAKQEESSAVCCLCQLPGGDLAATSCGQVAHIMCLLYTPETYFDDNLGHGISDVTPERLGLTCEICKGKRGVNKLQCANKKCTKSFHVQCAYVRGQLTTYPSFTGWCAKHLKKADSQVQASIDWPPHIKKQLIKEGKIKENDTSLLPPPPDPSLIPPHKREAAKEKKKSVNRKRKPDVVTQVKAEVQTSVKDEPVTSIVKHEFNVGDTIQVQERTWSGINKPGGVGRIKKKHVSPGNIVTYDIDYVLGGGEKGVESFYVSPVDMTNDDTGKKRRRANYNASYECE